MFIALVLSCTGARAAELPAGPLTLEAAVNIALQRNNDIKAARGSESAARHALNSSYGAFLPHLNAEGKYTRLNGPIDLDLNAIRSAIISADAATALVVSANPATAAGVTTALNGALPAFTMRVQDESYYNLTLSAVQTIYAGGRLAAAASAKKAAFNSAERSSAASVERVAADVVSSYFRLLLARRSTEIRQEVLAGMKDHDYTAQKLFEQGMISKANRMRAGAALAEASREAAKAGRDEELAGILLGNLLNVEVSSFTLGTDFFAPVPAPELPTLIARAMASNPALNMLDQSAKQLEAKRKAAKGAMLPSVFAFGKYEAYKADLTALEPEWAAGIGVKMSLFSGMSDYEDIQEAAAQKEALARFTDGARELVKTQVRKCHHDMLTAAEQYESLGVSLELAEENLRLNKLSFAQGVCTSLEVIDAELALGKVKTERYKALYDYASALAELLRATGGELEILKYGENKI